MEIGHFYFLSDQYFFDFPDDKLMSNRESEKGVPHDRPCFCAIREEYTGLFWMVPISSQITKFEQIYKNKVDKRGRCDTIDFGFVLGHKKAFLLQNMCPVSNRYIKNEYLDPVSNMPVKLDGAFERQLEKKAAKVLALHRRGIPLIFPDVAKIEKELSSQIDS